jgi:hypothetical protein
MDCIGAVPDMSGCNCVKGLSMHQIVSILFGLWTGIAGIAALTLNDMSQCAESYQTLRVAGIGLTAVSICYFSSCFFWKRNGFELLLICSPIFVFVLDCILIDDMARGNQTGDCSGGRGTLRLFMTLWTIPFVLTGCGFLSNIGKNNHNNFYGLSEEIRTLLL